MASTIWDVAQSQARLTEEIRYFLYKDGKPLVKGGLPGTYNQHTEAEYREMLDRIMRGLYDDFNSIADEMGWNG